MGIGVWEYRGNGVMERKASSPTPRHPDTPIQVLFLLDKLAPAGTQTNLLKVVRHLDRSRFEPHVIALMEGGELMKEFQEAGVDPVVLNTGRIYSLSGWRTFQFLVKWMREHRIDIVQTHFLHADILGVLAGRKAGVKKMVTARRDEGFWRSGRQLVMNRFLNCFTDRILANSQAVARAVMEKEKVPASKIDVIYNGVEVPHHQENPKSEARISDLQKSLGLQPHDIAIGVVANMRHAIKGHAYLLEAVAIAVKKMPQVKLLLAGDGPLRPGLEQQAAKLGIEKSVFFLGVRRDIPAILNAIDIACLPSLTEGFSNSILEYMAYAKPVIATAVGGNPEVVTPETGFLVPPRDAKALADKILALAESETLRMEMGNAGRRRVEEQFSTKKMTKSYEAFYSSLMNGRHAGGINKC